MGMHVPGPLHRTKSGLKEATEVNEVAIAARVVKMLVKYDCMTFLARGMVFRVTSCDAAAADAVSKALALF